jgi:hypothetical protein
MIWGQDGDKFIGKLSSIHTTQLEIEGEMEDRLVIEIEDLSGTREEPHLIFCSISNRKNSKWGRWRSYLYDLGFEPTSTEEVLGYCFEFDRVDFDFGGDYVSQDVPVPVRYIPNEEDAVREAKEMVGADSKSTGGVDSQDAKDKQVVLDTIDGLTYQEFLSKVTQNPEVTSNAELLSKLADPNQKLVERMVENGELQKSEDGTYTVV